MQPGALSRVEKDRTTRLWILHLPSGWTGAVDALSLWRHGTLESGSWQHFHKWAEDDQQ